MKFIGGTPHCVETDNRDDESFGREYLDKIASYISRNYGPNQMFDAEEVCEAARDHIATYYDPADVFDADALATWAEANGYVKQDN